MSNNQMSFIQKHVAVALIKDGYSPVQGRVYAKDAADYYRHTTTFKKGAYADCLAYARDLAKKGVRK